APDERPGDGAAHRHQAGAVGVRGAVGSARLRDRPVASMRQAAARNPRWETVILPGVGNTPQLEVPDNVIGTLRDWLGKHFTPTAG
ncbi:MAG: alpha/beta fold hydrolase, partial [Streptosporangiaceae bacterium]